VVLVAPLGENANRW